MMGLLSLLLFGDPHYGSSDIVGGTGTQARTQCLSWMQDAFDSAAVRGFVPDLTGSVGDNNTPDNAGEKTSLLDAILSKLTTDGVGTPFSAMGNHDFDQATLAEVRAVAASYFDWYEAGVLYGSFDVNGFHIVVLDSNYHSVNPYAHISAEGSGTGAKGYVPQAELDWLTADLAATFLPVLVFTHQSLSEFDGTTFYTVPTTDIERYSTVNRAEVRTILEASGKVICVFEGHQHFSRAVNINGIFYIDLPSLVGLHPYPTRLLAGDKGIWAEVTIDSTRKTIRMEVYEDDSTAGVQLSHVKVYRYGPGSNYHFPLYNDGELTDWTVSTATTSGVPDDIVLTNAPATGLLPNGLIIQGGASASIGTAKHTIEPLLFPFLVSLRVAKEETDKAINLLLKDGATEAFRVQFNTAGNIVVGAQTLQAYSAGQVYVVTLRCHPDTDTVDVIINGVEQLTGASASTSLASVDGFYFECPAGAGGTAYTDQLLVHSAQWGGRFKRNIGGIWQ